MGSSTNRWSREEIEETFQHHQDVVVEIGKVVGLVPLWRPVHGGRDLHRAPLRKDGGPQTNQRVDRVDDGRVPGQRDAVLPGHVVLDRRRQGLGVQRVSWSSDSISVGMLTSSNASAISSSGDVNGCPACGLRTTEGYHARLRERRRSAEGGDGWHPGERGITRR